MRLKAGLWTSVLVMLTFGCRTYTVFLKPDEQPSIDRSVVDRPPSFDLKESAHNLNCPTGFCVDQDGTWFYVEGGISNQPIHIFGRRADGSTLEIYPGPTHVPFINRNFKIFGPIGGIVASNGKVFISHHDENDMSVITAFGYDGSHATVVSDFPGQGDYGITDLTISPNGRLYFGVGPATNSGIVGIDNWQDGWLKKHPDACDVSLYDLKLYGLKFTSSNPFAGIFGGGGNTGVTGPYQPFNINDRTRIKKAADAKANSCVYSVSLTGGDSRPESSGIRLPRGLGYRNYACYATNDGMEMRGTRPIKDDPDAFIKTASADAWFGFPDYSTDLFPISDARFQPPASLLTHGYPSIDQLIDKDNGSANQRLVLPERSTYINGVFPSMSGAAKFDFIPDNTTVQAYKKFAGEAIVALCGDRAPFANGGMPADTTIGCKIVSVDTEKKKVADFIFNTKGLPASKLGRDVIALEHPCDVKLGPDGILYILDMGRYEMKDGKINVAAHTGRIFKLIPIVEPERPAPK